MLKLKKSSIPQKQLQLSDVIMQARDYMKQLAGTHGNVLTHHKTLSDLERYLSNFSDKKEVQAFLDKIQHDKDGWELF